MYLASYISIPVTSCRPTIRILASLTGAQGSYTCGLIPYISALRHIHSEPVLYQPSRTCLVSTFKLPCINSETMLECQCYQFSGPIFLYSHTSKIPEHEVGVSIQGLWMIKFLLFLNFVLCARLQWPRHLERSPAQLQGDRLCFGHACSLRDGSLWGVSEFESLKNGGLSIVLRYHLGLV